MKATSESERRAEAARQLRRVKKTTERLCRLYPELATAFRIQDRRFQRSVAAAILVSESSKDARNGT